MFSQTSADTSHLVAPVSAVGLLGFIITELLDNACGPNAARGPDGEQDFKFCASSWPSHAVYPVWGISLVIVICAASLLQRWLNKKHPFFGNENLPSEPSGLTTLKL